MNKIDAFFICFALLLFWTLFIIIAPLSWTKNICWIFGSYYIGVLIARFSIGLVFNKEKEQDKMIKENFVMMDDMLNNMKDMTKLIHRQQARIDLLMMEYCPDEMTPAQLANWAAHQETVSLEMEKKIKDALH